MQGATAAVKTSRPIRELLQEDGRLSLDRATRAEKEMRRIAQFSLLGSDALIRVEELAAILGCSPRFIRKLRNAERLPRAFRIGQLVRWRLGAVRFWIWKRCEGQPPLEPFPGIEPVEDRLLASANLALILSCSDGLVWKLRKAGELPPDCGRKASVRWRLSDVRCWIRQRVGL